MPDLRLAYLPNFRSTKVYCLVMEPHACERLSRVAPASDLLVLKSSALTTPLPSYTPMVAVTCCVWLTLPNATVQFSTVVNDLGVLIDSQLSMSNHIAALS